MDGTIMPTRFDSIVVEKGKEKKPVLRFRFKGFKKSDTASAVVADKTLTVIASKGSDDSIAVINDVDIQENPEVKTSKTCGQTPCGDTIPKFCCDKNMTRIDSGPCCCYINGTTSFFDCRSGGSSSGGFPWWGVFLIVPFIIAV